MWHQGMSYALIAVFLWSTVATVFKLTLRGVDHVQMLFYSSLSSCLILGILAAVKMCGRWQELLPWHYWRNNLLLGLFNPFLYYLVLFKAYSLLPAQEAQPLNYTWPIALSAFAVLFLNQRLHWRNICGLVLAFSGVCIIATRGAIWSLQFHSGIGVVLAVGSSGLWAGYWTINLLDQRDSLVKLFGAFVVGTGFSAIYLGISGGFALNDYRYLWGTAYIGMFEMGITFFLWLKALEASQDRAKTSTLAYLSPFFSLVFIAGVLGERIALSSLIGLMLIIAGVCCQHTRLTKTANSTVMK